MQDWEHLLLKVIKCFEPIHYIAQLMTRPTTTILIASNDSAFEQGGIMSFGWKISLLDATTLATHSGSAIGHASLFYTKGYGLLSVSRFLHHLQKYTNLTPACKIKIYIDNKGIVTWVNNQIGYTFDYLYNTLEPDWDVITQSAEYLRRLSTKLTIGHVRSDQDNKCNFEQLDLPAQFNMSADNLATSYREGNNEKLVDIPRLSINHAQLVHDRGIITGHHFKKIRDISTEKDLASHIMKTNAWTSETFSWIDWSTFQKYQNSMDQGGN
eukprot:3417103-Ditylum_brightwellii.AAC.1